MIRGLMFKKPKEIAELAPEDDGIRVLLDGREICNAEAWKKRRMEVYRRDGGRCQLKTVCRGGVVPTNDFECHHKRTRGIGGGKRDDRFSNLITVCKPCHREVKS